MSAVWVLRQPNRFNGLGKASDTAAASSKCFHSGCRGLLFAHKTRYLAAVALSTIKFLCPYGVRQRLADPDPFPNPVSVKHGNPWFVQQIEFHRDSYPIAEGSKYVN